MRQESTRHAGPKLAKHYLIVTCSGWVPCYSSNVLIELAAAAKFEPEFFQSLCELALFSEVSAQTVRNRTRLSSKNRLLHSPRHESCLARPPCTSRVGFAQLQARPRGNDAPRSTRTSSQCAGAPTSAFASNVIRCRCGQAPVAVAIHHHHHHHHRHQHLIASSSSLFQVQPRISTNDAQQMPQLLQSNSQAPLLFAASRGWPSPFRSSHAWP